MADKKETFLDRHKQHLELLGFWDEQYLSVIIRQIESQYLAEIISEWGISDIVINKDKILLKWYKRHHPLSKEELKDRYGIE